MTGLAALHDVEADLDRQRNREKHAQERSVPGTQPAWPDCQIFAIGQVHGYRVDRRPDRQIAARIADQGIPPLPLFDHGYQCVDDDGRARLGKRQLPVLPQPRRAAPARAPSRKRGSIGEILREAREARSRWWRERGVGWLAISISQGRLIVVRHRRLRAPIVGVTRCR